MAPKKKKILFEKKSYCSGSTSLQSLVIHDGVSDQVFSSHNNTGFVVQEQTIQSSYLTMTQVNDATEASGNFLFGFKGKLALDLIAHLQFKIILIPY